MSIRVYSSFACGNARIRREQQYIQRILYIKGIDFEDIDISDPMHLNDRHFMKSKFISDEEAESDERKVVLPPQIFKDDIPCGTFDGLFDAVEAEALYAYLGIDVPKTELEYLNKFSSEEIITPNESSEVESAPVKEETVEKVEEIETEKEPDVPNEASDEKSDENENAEEIKEELNQTDEKKIDEEKDDEKIEEDSKEPEVVTEEVKQEEESKADIEAEVEESKSDAESEAEESEEETSKEDVKESEVKVETKEEESSEEESSEEESDEE